MMMATLNLPRLLEGRSVRAGALSRALAAGTAWGIAMTAGLAATNLWSCGGICLPDIAVTAAISVSAGIVCIGPIAAFGRGAAARS